MQDLEDFDMDLDEDDDLQEDYSVIFNGSVNIPDLLYKKTLDKMGFQVDFPEAQPQTAWGKSGPVRSVRGSRPVRAGSRPVRGASASDSGITAPPTDGGYTKQPVK